MRDDVIERLRAARPPQATPDGLDGELLRRVMEQRPPHRRRLALPAAAMAVVAIAAVVVASNLGSPDGARAAISRTLHWFDPPAGTILHVRSVMTGAAGSPLTQESWQSVDHPAEERRSENGVETDATGDIYDPATDTIYAYVAPSRDELRKSTATAFKAKIAGARAAGADATTIAQLRRDRDAALRRIAAGQTPSKPDDSAARVGDALANQMRDLLRAGDATVGAETTHDGVRAFPITVSPGGAHWTMWARAGDGRPLELRVDGDGPIKLGANLETVRWPDYEVVPGDRAGRVLTIAGAHPDARVVREAGAYAAAERRLFPHG